MRSAPLTTVKGGINRLRTRGGAKAEHLYDLVNGYVTEAGTVVSRPGTVREATLNSLTRGLCAYGNSLHTFCHVDVAVPTGYTLHILNHPDSAPVTVSTPATQQFAFLEYGLVQHITTGTVDPTADAGGWATIDCVHPIDTFNVPAELANYYLEKSRFAFGNSGTRLYFMFPGGAAKLLSMTLSTPYDLTTATDSNESLALATFITSPSVQNFRFSPDGTKLYVIGVNYTAGPDYYDEIIWQYTLSTAWDLSTATYANLSYNRGPTSGYRPNLCFNAARTRMLLSDGPMIIKEYDLSTAWDISTATATGVSHDFSVSFSFFGGGGITSFCLSADELTLYCADLEDGILAHFADRVFKFSLASAASMATVTTQGVFYPAADASFADFALMEYTAASETVSTANNIALEKIHFAEPFMGALYVVAEFVDGAIYHYWLQSGTAWAANTVYHDGDLVVSSTPNGLVYQATRYGSPYPSWAPDVPRADGTGPEYYAQSIVEPTVYNDYYYTCVNVDGTNPRSGSTEPEWPTEEGAQIVEAVDNGEVVTGLVSTTAPPESSSIPSETVRIRYAR